MQLPDARCSACSTLVREHTASKNIAEVACTCIVSRLLMQMAGMANTALRCFQDKRAPHRQLKKERGMAVRMPTTMPAHVLADKPSAAASSELPAPAQE